MPSCLALKGAARDWLGGSVYNTRWWWENPSMQAWIGGEYPMPTRSLPMLFWPNITLVQGRAVTLEKMRWNLLPLQSDNEQKQQNSSPGMGGSQEKSELFEWYLVRTKWFPSHSYSTRYTDWMRIWWAVYPTLTMHSLKAKKLQSFLKNPSAQPNVDERLHGPRVKWHRKHALGLSWCSHGPWFQGQTEGTLANYPQKMVVVLR